MDDSPSFLAAARGLIAAQPRAGRIDRAGTGTAAQARCGRLNPDPVLADIVMSDLSSRFEPIRRLRGGGGRHSVAVGCGVRLCA
jgi:DNA-binding NarL/FixJ family response regulator